MRIYNYTTTFMGFVCRTLPKFYLTPRADQNNGTNLSLFFCRHRKDRKELLGQWKSQENTQTSTPNGLHFLFDLYSAVHSFILSYFVCKGSSFKRSAFITRSIPKSTMHSRHLKLCCTDVNVRVIHSVWVNLYGAFAWQESVLSTIRNQISTNEGISYSECTLGMFNRALKSSKSFLLNTKLILLPATL